MKIDTILKGGKKLAPGCYKVGACKVEQTCDRVVRTVSTDDAIQIIAEQTAADWQIPVSILLGQGEGNTEDGRAFLENRARQMGISVDFGDEK